MQTITLSPAAQLLATGEGVNFYNIAGQVYRVPAEYADTLDVDGLPMSRRWECSVAHWERFRSVYAWAADVAEEKDFMPSSNVIWTKPNPSPEEEIVIGLLDKHFATGNEPSEEIVEAVRAAMEKINEPHFGCCMEAAAREVGFDCSHRNTAKLLKNKIVLLNMRRHVEATKK